MPRPAPRRDDETAERFLNAGTQLLEAALGDDSGPMPARLRQIKFPAALEWLRVEDVIRVAQTDDGESDSKRAFRNRWATKDDFVRDLVLWCLEYKDTAGLSAPQTYAARVILLDPEMLVSHRVEGFVSSLLRELVTNPRSYLLAHIAPMLSGHGDLHDSLVEFSRDEIGKYKAVYAEILEMLGAPLRPGWTLDSLALAFQAMLDGLVLRHRIDPKHSPMSNWAAAGFATDAMLGIMFAAVDLDGSRKTMRQLIDETTQARTELAGA